MTASPPPPLVRCLMEMRAILECARRRGHVRGIGQAIERINPELACERAAGRPGR